MTRSFRVIDTGLRGARANIAFDQAMIEAHEAGAIPDSIRFVRFPPCVLIGRHQALSQEVRLDWCRVHGLEIARRISGGGAVFMGPGLIAWELAFARATLGLARLGIDARHRPRNDIEVDGRKISGTGGFFDGDTLFYQGTLIVDFDPQLMVAALNVPAEKLAKRALDSAAQRIVTLKELLGTRMPAMKAIQEALLAGFAAGLGIAPAWGEPSAREEALARDIHDREIGTDAFVALIDPPPTAPDLVTASRAGAGGTVKANIRLEDKGTRVREVLITGDFFVTPPRVVYDLEASLRGLAVGEVPAAIDRFFASAEVGLLTIAPADFKAVVQEALLQARVQHA